MLGCLTAPAVSARAQPLETGLVDTENTTSAQESDPDKRASEKRPRGWHFRWTDHPALWHGRNTTMAFTARFQGDAYTPNAAAGGSGFNLARRRIGTEGRIAGLIDFELDYELGDDRPWRDAYLEYRQIDRARVRAGQFKLPFSLDENTGAANLDFVHRSRAASQLAPGRDPGVLVSGRVLRTLVRYEAGVFGRDGANARTRNEERVHGGTTVAGRVTVQPFRGTRPALQDLQVGIAVTGSEVPEGLPALRGRTALDDTFFRPDVWVQGHRRRTGVELRWRPGPASLKAEYMRVTTERLGQSVENTDLPPLVGTGWYISGTWLVTGEAKRDGLVSPRRPLFRGIGAVELALRVEGLTFGSRASTIHQPSTSPRAENILGNSLRGTTLGLNWFPFRTLKIQANLIRESLARPDLGPVPSQPAYWSRVLRFQLAI